MEFIKEYIKTHFKIPADLSKKQLFLRYGWMLLLFIGFLCGLIPLLGAEKEVPEEPSAIVESVPPETTPVGVVPGNGDPTSLFYAGCYTTDTPAPKEVVARIDQAALSNDMLQLCYRLEIAACLSAPSGEKPDLAQPLAEQLCPLAETDMSWEQYFLDQAITRWHTLQALSMKTTQFQPLQDPDYKVNEYYREICPMEHLDLYQYLYREKESFTPNSLHQAFLDELPSYTAQTAKALGYADTAAMAQDLCTSEDTLAEYIQLLNFSYSYYTELSYDAIPTEEEILLRQAELSGGEPTVDLRQLFIAPKSSSEKSWEEAHELALETLEKCRGDWLRSRFPEGSFGQFAHDYSQDEGTRLDGGQLNRITKGMLLEELDAWCFAAERQVGDMELIRSSLGWHIVYLADQNSTIYADAKSQLLKEALDEQLKQIRAEYPIKVNYRAAALTAVSAAPQVTESDLLYPDIAHQRYPEPIIFLQQDYASVPYGPTLNVGNGGCGITTLAMLATYLSDELHTPAEMSRRYAQYYASSIGTGGEMFLHVGPDMEFYTLGSLFGWDNVINQLKADHVVVNLQHAGFFTRGGHYLLLYRVNEDGTVSIRDSNIFNYKRIEEYEHEHFDQRSVMGSSVVFYAFDNKIIRISACSRCSENYNEVQKTSALTGEYICRKCATALDRRNAFLYAD